MAGLFGYTPSRNVQLALTRIPAIRRQTRVVAVAVRAEAQRNAPKKTGAGAASIRVASRTVQGAAEYRVTWDRDHFYMAFHEFGTVKMPARPFLRPAAELFQRRGDSARSSLGA